MYTVAQLKESVSGLLSGTDLDNVTNLNGALERAARKLAQKADVPEATARQSITLYDGVYTYTAPTNIFGGALIDLRPQGVARTSLDEVRKQPIALFDQQKHLLPSGYAVTLEHTKGTPLLRVTTPKPMPRVIIDTMKETTGWTAGGSLGSLAQDLTVYYEYPASLRFTLTGSSTGTLTKTISSLSIATYEDVAVGFLAIRIPDGATASNLTSVAVRLGSDSSNYDEVTATTGFLEAFKAGDWMLIALDFSGATSTGTPDWTALDYLQVRLAHSGTFTNFRVGGFWLALPSPHELIYQTPAIFLVGSTLNKTITNDEDQIILNDAAYLLYEHECALQIAVQQRNDDQIAQLRAILYGGEDDLGLYEQYRADNPSNELREIGNYY